MKKLISEKLADNMLLISLGVLAIFDILILLNIVPSNIVWGGQIKDPAANLVVLELISLVVTSIFALVIAVKMDYIKACGFTKAVNIGVWIIFAYLILNTLGNLASGVSFENLIFAPITLVLAFCAFRLAIEK
jgi:hypothetical protein